MKVNMNFMRQQMSASFNRLGTKLLSVMHHVPTSEHDELLKRFSDLAAYIGGLNCIYTDEKGLFDDISEQVEVMDIWEKRNFSKSRKVSEKDNGNCRFNQI